MSQPFNMFATHKALGKLDKESGEFWMENPWETKGNNLSAYERHRILLNTGKGAFVDVSQMSGGGIDSDGRCAVAADFDGDGMQDLMVRNSGGGPLFVFANRHPKTHWLQVSLTGVKCNRQGIGARLKFEADGREIHRDLFPHNSYYSQMPSNVHVGLGDSKRVERLTIQWPSGETQTLENVAADQHIRVTEGSAEYTRVSQPNVAAAGQ